MIVLLDDNVSYSAPINCTQKLKLMREGGHFTYSSNSLSHAAPVGRNPGIGVDCNLFC
jgi:hypothetical protein